MTDPKAIKTKKFVNAFYDLFTMYSGKYFIGTKEQARLFLQLQFNWFIPKNYIDKAFSRFSSANLIRKTGERIVLGDFYIGKKYFPKRSQIVFEKVPMDENMLKESLEKIEIVFKDIYLKISELPSEKDIAHLRELEKQKNISFRELAIGRVWGIKQRDYQTDEGLLYDFSKKEIIEIIKNLEFYDPVYKENLKETILEMKQQKQQELNENWNKVIIKAIKLIYDSYNKSTKKVVKIINEYYETFVVGSCIPESLEFNNETNTLKISAQNFEFEVSVRMVDILIINGEMYLEIANSMGFLFHIESKHRKELEFIRILLNKISELRNSIKELKDKLRYNC